jgi:hypothetical protein
MAPHYAFFGNKPVQEKVACARGYAFNELTGKGCSEDEGHKAAVAVRLPAAGAGQLPARATWAGRRLQRLLAHATWKAGEEAVVEPFAAAQPASPVVKGKARNQDEGAPAADLLPVGTGEARGRLRHSVSVRHKVLFEIPRRVKDQSLPVHARKKEALPFFQSPLQKRSQIRLVRQRNKSGYRGQEGPEIRRREKGAEPPAFFLTFRGAQNGETGFYPSAQTPLYRLKIVHVFILLYVAVFYQITSAWFYAENLLCKLSGRILSRASLFF